MTERLVDHAWAAGLFEGEGWISDADRSGVYLGLGMTDEDVVTRFQSIAGYGNIRVKVDNRQPEWKTMYVWQCKKALEVVRILSFMLPYLGERRKARAMCALNRLEGVNVK